MKILISCILFLVLIHGGAAQPITTKGSVEPPEIVVVPSRMSAVQINRIEVYFSHCESFLNQREAYEWIMQVYKDSSIASPIQNFVPRDAMQMPLEFSDLNRPYKEAKVLYLQFVIRNRETKKVVEKSVIAKL